MREKVRSRSEAVVHLVVDQAAHRTRVDVSEGLHVGGEAGPGVARPEQVGGGGERGAVSPVKLRHHQASPSVRLAHRRSETKLTNISCLS